MFNNSEGNIYYISNLGTGKVSIIDGDSFQIIKDIEVGPRPQDIIVDEENNVYIASDRNSKVTIIDDLYDANKSWYMPNNGNIRVDSVAQKIYVCNAEEVCVYSLKTGEKIASLRGFYIADSLELDKDKKKLFVLDVFLNEIRVYDTINFNLINVYEDIGNAPSYILMSEDGRKMYISNKGINKGNNMGNISILDLEDGSISYIDFPIGSIIADLEQNGIFLYVANSGLNRIEVIDTLKKDCISTLKTNHTELQKLRLSPDKKILLVTCLSSDGKGVVDRIDMNNNTILDTFTFKEKNSIPYDIGIVIQKNLKVEKDTFIFTDSKDKENQEEGITLLAKKVLSTYQEKIFFSQVSVELPTKDEDIKSIEGIIFQKCEVIKGTQNRKIIEGKKRHSILEYEFYIPYYIEGNNQLEEKYLIKGKLKGAQKATLYIPDYEEQKGVEFSVHSFSKLTSTPVVIGKSLNFDLSVLISTKAIVEDLVFIPFYKHSEGSIGEIKNG